MHGSEVQQLWTGGGVYGGGGGPPPAPQKVHPAAPQPDRSAPVTFRMRAERMESAASALHAAQQRPATR